MLDNFTDKELYKLYTLLTFYNSTKLYDGILKDITYEINHRLNLDQLTIN